MNGAAARRPLLNAAGPAAIAAVLNALIRALFMGDTWGEAAVYAGLFGLFFFGCAYAVLRCGRGAGEGSGQHSG